MLRRSFALALPALAACAAGGPVSPRSWAGRKARHATKLLSRGPAPSPWKPQPVPADVREVRYTSAGRSLLAWYAAPAGASGKVPGLVYFHGEFAFAAWDFAQVRPFLAAGFAVMTPSLRGENGNPGDFELLYGEVDDARAALVFRAAQNEVDAGRIYTLGHSVGGGVSALLSLVPDLPARCTASVGGIYTTQTFVRWTRWPDTRPLVRFDPAAREEAELRVLAPHLADMRRPHRAYVGRGDETIFENARAVAREAAERRAPFTLIELEGDHAASLQPGVARYLADLTRDPPVA